MSRRPLPTTHAEARFEQRLVVRFAVISDQDVELRQVFVKTSEQRWLIAIIAHKELAQPETGLVDRADTDQKRIRPGAARETRGFGIEECPFDRVRAGD